MIPNPFNHKNPSSVAPLAERYQLIKELDTNGAERTFLARDLYSPGHATQCVVEALDLPSCDMSQLQAIRQLFHTHAKRLTQLGEYEQIAPMLAHFEKGGVFYTIRAWVEGRSLAQIFVPGQPWADQRVVLLLDNLLGTLEHIHQADMLHLDLQPSHVVCDRTTNQLTVINFGSFQQQSAQLIAPIPRLDIPQIFDPSRYIPHEQIAGHPQPASDIYAVGMIAAHALTGFAPDALALPTENRDLQWPSFATLRHPALLSFIQSMVRYSFRDRYQSAAEARTALRALPDDLTEPLLVSAIFPQPEYAFDPAEETAVEDEREESLAKTLVPVGVGLAAVVGTGALALQATDPVKFIQSINRGAAVPSAQPRDTDATSAPVASREVEPLDVETVEEAIEENELAEAATAEDATVDGPIAETPNSEGSIEGATGGAVASSAASSDEGPAAVQQVEAQVTPPVEAAVPPEAAYEDFSEDFVVTETPTTGPLTTEVAKATVDRFYERVANRSWSAVRALLSDRLAKSLEPDFFYQFEEVSVDDYQVVNQTPEAINLVVKNTYVYLDGSYQREERSYTVEMVNNQPTIVDTAFEQVTRDRSY